MDFIDRLEEPRRSEIQSLHELIREVAPALEVQAGEDMIGYASVSSGRATSTSSRCAR